MKSYIGQETKYITKIIKESTNNQNIIKNFIKEQLQNWNQRGKDIKIFFYVITSIIKSI